TIRKEILAQRDLSGDEALRQALAEYGLRMTRSLGFSNSYAIGMKQDLAERLGIRTIADLKHHPELKLGFTNEFLDRGDGWPGLKRHYQLPQRNISGLEHALAYSSLDAGTIQATDLYTTDAKIQTLKLRVLVDDKSYFPSYQAVFVYRGDLEEKAPAVVAALRRLEGRITEADMIDLNAKAELDRLSESVVAGQFLRAADLITDREYEQVHVESTVERLLRATRQHLTLVAVSLGAAILCAVPLGILAARHRKIGQTVLAVAGVIQTIPSIAMLSFLIPLLDIGPRNAIAALFLY